MIGVHEQGQHAEDRDERHAEKEGHRTVFGRPIPRERDTECRESEEARIDEYRRENQVSDARPKARIEVGHVEVGTVQDALDKPSGEDAEDDDALDERVNTRRVADKPAHDGQKAQDKREDKREETGLDDRPCERRKETQRHCMVTA